MALYNWFTIAWRAAGSLAVLGLLRFFQRLYQVRTHVRRTAKEHGVKMMPHSFLFGHLIEIAKVAMKHAPDCHGEYMPLFLQHAHPDLCRDGLVYMDVWPINQPMLSVFHPDLQAQFCQDPSLPKADLLHSEFEPMSRCRDLVNLEGAEWKMWRSVYNPGFSVKNILALVPAMLEEAEVFVKWLEGTAKDRKVHALGDNLDKLTTDVIGRVVLGTRLHAQEIDSPVYVTMKRLVAWLINDNNPANILKQINPFRQLIISRLNQTMKAHCQPHLERTIAEFDTYEGPKTINSLAIKTYLELSGTPTSQASAKRKFDQEFLDLVIEQIKIFLFAGSDTTATTLCMAYFLLSRNSTEMAVLRAEHDTILGSDPHAAVNILAANPSLLNQLPYTSAVIRETLRLYPPVGSVRAGQPDVFLTHPTSRKRYPTDGFMLFSCSAASHRHPGFWPRPDDFVPERWLAREGEPLHVPKNLFRPFELGPRNCIGQELALTEMRMVLVLTARRFEFEPAFPEDGPRVFGELAYLAHAPGNITAHPKAEMPMRVKMRQF